MKHDICTTLKFSRKNVNCKLHVFIADLYGHAISSLRDIQKATDGDRETEVERGRQRYRVKERDREREIGRETDRETETGRDTARYSKIQ